MSVLYLMCSMLLTLFVNGDVISVVGGQGLYSSQDHVTILTAENFEQNVYGQDHAILLQFYNSYCGHCRAFAPKFKEAAENMANWSNFVQLAVMDCSVEENNRYCREFEVISYPSMRILHEGFQKGNGDFGDQIKPLDSAQKIRETLVQKLHLEQKVGRMNMIPSLGISSPQNYLSATQDIPQKLKYVFLVFENDNSTIGPDLILDMHDYDGVAVKRIRDTSELASNVVSQFPALVVIERPNRPLVMTPRVPTKENMKLAVNSYLQSKHYTFPEHRSISNYMSAEVAKAHHINENDVTYYENMEKALHTMFDTEFTRSKVLKGSL